MGVGSEKCLVMKYEHHSIYLTNLDSTAYYYNIIVGAVLLLYDWQCSRLHQCHHTGGIVLQRLRCP